MPSFRNEILVSRDKANRVLSDFRLREFISMSRMSRIDPYMVADRAGVVVMRRPMHKLLGAYLNHDRPGILINSDRPRGMVSFTLAHELGHHFLSHGIQSDNTIELGGKIARHEVEANTFALGLTAPRWLVVENLKRLNAYKSSEIAKPHVQYQLSLRLGLSYSATRHALLQYNLLEIEVFHATSSVQPRDLKREILGQTDVRFSNQNDVWLLDEGDRSQVLSASPYDLFVWRHPSHAAAGYAWTLDEASQAGFEFDLIQSHKESAIDPNNIGGLDMVLAGFHCANPSTLEPTNTVKAELSEKRPWQKNAEPISKIEFFISVDHVRAGLSSQSRQYFIQSAALIQ